jgi:hypothetical protein
VRWLCERLEPPPSTTADGSLCVRTVATRHTKRSPLACCLGSSRSLEARPAPCSEAGVGCDLHGRASALPSCTGTDIRLPLLPMSSALRDTSFTPRISTTEKRSPNSSTVSAMASRSASTRSSSAVDSPPTACPTNSSTPGSRSGCCRHRCWRRRVGVPREPCSSRGCPDLRIRR